MISSRENSSVVVEDFLRLPVSSLSASQREGSGVLVAIEVADASSQVAVKLTWSRLWHGGKRWWWLCPICGARRSVLLLWGLSIGCRGCFRAAYRSQKQWPRRCSEGAGDTE